MFPVSCRQLPATCRVARPPALPRLREGQEEVRAFSTGSGTRSRNFAQVSRPPARSLRQTCCLRPTLLRGAHGGEFRLHFLFFFLGQHCGSAGWWHVVNGRVFGGDRGTLRRAGRQAADLGRHFGQHRGTSNHKDRTRADQHQPSEALSLPANFRGGISRSHHLRDFDRFVHIE